MLDSSLRQTHAGKLKTLTLAGILPVLVFIFALVLTMPAQAAPSGEETETDLKAYMENNLTQPAGSHAVQKQSLSTAAVQPQWLMGPFSSSYYNDPISGFLFNYTMEQIGYYGTTDTSYPRVGDLYYGAIVVGNVSPNFPAYPIIDVKLPRDTQFDIDTTVAQKKIRCYLHNFNTGGMQELTGNMCPTTPSQGIHGANLNPPGGLELQPGYAIEIQFPIRSSKTLQGLADPTGGSCLIGAVTVGFYDDVPLAGEKCPLADNHGVYQGVFVSPALDTTAPTGTIKINNGAAYTTSPEVNLSLSATDSGSGLSSMRFRNENTQTWSAWEPYATTKQWTLSSADGSKSVYIQYKDKAGNVSTAARDLIKLDTTAPTVKRVIPEERATGIAPGTHVHAFFSEAMRAGSINKKTFKLFKVGSTTPVSAQVSYDPDKKRAILNPESNLKRGTSYRAVVSRGVRDLAGNRMAAGKAWVFKTM